MLDQSHSHWLNLLLLTGWGALFGAMGGVVRILRRGVHGWVDFAVQCIVSAFCGVITFAMLSGVVSDMAVVACCGIAGNSGGMMLDAVRMRFLKQIKGGK